MDDTYGPWKNRDVDFIAIRCDYGAMMEGFKNAIDKFENI